jgi:hypothetical protein
LVKTKKGTRFLTFLHVPVDKRKNYLKIIQKTGKDENQFLPIIASPPSSLTSLQYFSGVTFTDHNYKKATMSRCMKHPTVGILLGGFFDTYKLHSCKINQFF